MTSRGPVAHPGRVFVLDRYILLRLCHGCDVSSVPPKLAWDVHLEEAGKTGVPYIDACMRELKQTGWLAYKGRSLRSVTN